uniref:acyl carrier protein n=1 Tax=Eubacterium cellulosolvens TaxID=29322 RepID=UPI00048899C0|nr:acyl carrier protein [[Eubacterium] cellulosolvens]
MLEILQKIVADILRLDYREVLPESTFFCDLGADSLDLYQIMIRVSEQFYITISSEEFEKVTKVSDVVDLIQKKVN